jgi:hypothetical protein
MSTPGKKRERFITAAGIAMYPRVNTPDFKYKKETGEYSMKLKLSEADSAPLIEKIKDETEKAYKAFCAKEEKPKLKRCVNIPYKVETDDNEKETGNVIFSFKLPGKVKNNKTGEWFNLKPQLFNKAGQVIEDEIWGGSTVKVAYEFRPYYTEGLGVGMTLRVLAVQVHTLVTRGMGGSAEHYGFEVEEAETPDAEETETPAATTEPKAKATGGDF